MLRLAVEDRPGLEISTLELESGEVCYTIDTLRRLRRGPPARRPVFVMGMDSLLEIETWREYEELVREFDLAVIDRPGSALEEVRPRLPELVGGSLVELAGPSPALPPGADLGSGGRIFHLPMAEQPVSSTEIRRLAAGGLSLAGLVPPAVDRYIRANDLYR